MAVGSAMRRSLQHARTQLDGGTVYLEKPQLRNTQLLYNRNFHCNSTFKLCFITLNIIIA